MAFETFFIKDPVINYDTGEVHFPFAFDQTHQFKELISFGRAVPQPNQNAFKQACQFLSIALGISYYKAFIPKEINIDFPLSETAKTFFKALYEKGLGEFAYRNELAIKDHFTFIHDNNAPQEHPNAELDHKNVVLIGGGKDSNVSIEIAKTFDTPTLLLAVNPKKPILDCAQQSGLPLITIKRQLDPLLFTLNDEGALNGHIPITGIISLITTAAAYVHQFDTIILSNERSASEGNLIDHKDGANVNHQYSKSFDFEQAFQAFLKSEMDKDLTYFSLLRPLSELQIAQNFAKTDIYDNAFTSCNKAFKINEKPDHQWCGHCPKCFFVFLMLATAMPLKRLETIFGQNLFADDQNLEGFKELVGLTDNKPWECVGEFKESATAFIYLSQQEGYKDLPIVQKMAALLPMSDDAYMKAYEDYFTPTSQHAIPSQFKEKLDAYIRE